MLFLKTPIEGLYKIELEKFEDYRGFFARIFCKKEFENQRLKNNIVQINNSYNKKKGTLRGLHYQLPPKAEVKIIRCIRGSIFDVVIDLRKDSPTFLKWFGCELNENNKKMLYVPEGFAHGFLTLEDDTEIIYFTTEFYSPQYERCIRWNDPKFSIQWPFEPTVISEKDRNAIDFDMKYHLGG
jgi:dTDP-4-dehydrorhamnose 3,5-epimerase